MKIILNSKKTKETALWLFFVGPIFILFTMFFFVPIISGIVYSFTDWDAINSDFNFVGLKNYIFALSIDTDFVASLGRTFYLAFFNVVLTNVLAMLFASALVSNFKHNNKIRTAIFLPNVISMVICGFIWQVMFTKIIGKFGVATGLGFLDRSWLGDPDTVLFSILLVSLWYGVGYVMTIDIAALQSVNESLIEAASLEGANGWQTFWKVKLPVILPTVMVGVFMNVSGSLKMFDLVFSLTGGGPGRASELAMLNVYREAYQFNNYGLGSAKAVILSVIIIAITIFQFRITAKNEVEM
ncbi:MAG: sugar ABC transporter permease [Spirochaetales bacterium]|nr:sugar ABC transporter permease [Spirochaetales bacterium]